jgi:hypothetical protein
MTQVTFGIASAAFLATNSVFRLAEDNEAKFPLAAKVVRELFTWTMIYLLYKPSKKPSCYNDSSKISLPQTV